MGLSELHGCESLLTQALGHLPKLWAWPDSVVAAHWRRETVAFLNVARRRFSPLMRQRIDGGDRYADALSEMRSGSEEPDGAHSWPEHCPFTVAELVAKQDDIAALIAKLG